MFWVHSNPYILVAETIYFIFGEPLPHQSVMLPPAGPTGVLPHCGDTLSSRPEE